MLEDIYSKYWKLVREFFGKEVECYSIIDKGAIDAIQKICKTIVDSIKLYLSGDIIKAYLKFSEVMVCCENNLPYKSVEHNVLFYRMRDKFDLVEKEQFFHLPVKMRSKCSSERYSIAGYPCFYLGYSKNDCFVEISRNGSMIGLSLNERYNMKVLDLTFYEEQMNKSSIENFIKVWPLIAACNLFFQRADTNGAKFREEYIVPQMLTTYLRHANTVDGICYYSVRNENLDTNGIGENDFRNLVLFPNISSAEYDMDLMNKFDWYQPFNVGKRTDA